MNKIFLTFADSLLKKTLLRIKQQAENMEFYDKIYAWDETSLAPEFREKFKDYLKHGSRGYGYWCWKSQIILQALESANEGDIVQYTDAGCHLNKKGLLRLKEYFEITDKSSHGLLTFEAKEPSPPLPEVGDKKLDLRDFIWTKGDLFDYFNVRNDPAFSHTQSIGAGIVFVKKCDVAIQLIKEWREVIDHGFHLIDNTPSRSPNFPGFIEHRHDQSIVSLLCKKHKISTLSAYEHWYPGKLSWKPNFKVLENQPIHVKRDKDFGSIGNIKNFTRRVILKLKRMYTNFLGKHIRKGQRK